MYNRGRVMIGAALIALGLLTLISAWLGVDFCALAFPLFLIAAGAYILLRPRTAVQGGAMHFRLLGDVKRSGVWTPLDEEVVILVGDTAFDLTQANLCPGETVIRVIGFVGDLKLIVPEPVPVAVMSASFLTSSRIFGVKRDTFLEPFETATDNYAGAESRLRFENWRFVSGVKLRRPED